MPESTSTATVTPCRRRSPARRPCCAPTTARCGSCTKEKNSPPTYDAAYVETLVLQERRRRELPSSTPLCLKRQELIDEIQLEDPDPAAYDRLCQELPNSAEVSTPEELPPTGDLPSQHF